MAGNVAFSAAIAEAHRLQLAARGQPIRYTKRVGGGSVDVPALKGETDRQAADSAGSLLSYASTDWIVSASSLTIAGVPVTPADGDAIVELDGTGTPTGPAYRVAPYAGGSSFRLDSTRQLWRIRTTQIA